MNTSMIEIKNLVTGYGRHTVTDNLTATIRPGELTSLLGANGIGKSTLLRTLCAFQPALDGSIYVNGKALDKMTQAEKSRTIGVVLTERVNDSLLTVHDLVALGRSPYTGFWGKLSPDDEETVTAAMQTTGIASMSRRRIATLSDGERQKTMIAKALAQKTPVILLDEPTAFLDFPSKVEIMRLLKSLAHEENKIIFMSTHDVEMALQLSDRLWLMTPQGITTGTPQELSSSGIVGQFLCCEGMTYDTETRTIILG